MHVLWIGTSAGVAFLRSGQIEIPHNPPESLREQIFGIAEDDKDSLWFVTSDHVLKVDRTRLLSGQIDDAEVESYGIADGLQGVEGVRRDRSIATDLSGRIWVSLNRGLAVTDPNLKINSSLPGRVRLESVLVAGVPVDLSSPLKIPAGGSSITFNYAGMNLAAMERVRFRYKLDGSDRGWGDAVAVRQVTYSHLNPGSYRFRVVASNGEGLWNGPESTISFDVEPAFWQTLRFQAACVLACLLAVSAIYRFRMSQLTQQLNVRFQERLAERTRIAQELHDTLLQGFLSASMQLDVAEDQLPADSPSKPTLKRILKLMEKVTDESRKALRGLRGSADEALNLEVAFSRIRQEFGTDEKTDYRVIIRGVKREPRLLICDEVYRIGREALVNAFVHAHAETIEVELEYASTYFRILVRDDGLGIAPHVLESGRDGHWGLLGMRERAERIGASLKLRSRVGAGTEVELTVPGTIAFKHGTRGPISQWLSWFSRERFGASPTHTSKRAHK